MSAEAALRERFGGEIGVIASGDKLQKAPELESLLNPDLFLPHPLGDLMLRPPALAEEARCSIEELSMTHADAPSGMVTISIGVESRVPQPGQKSACLVEAADRAHYDAKRRGRNAVVAHASLLLSAAS